MAGFLLVDMARSLVQSTVCPADGQAKRLRQSFCGGCWSRLPSRIQRSLWSRIGNGYETAFAEAMAFLGATEIRGTPATAPAADPADEPDELAAALATVVRFGKHSGKTLAEILREEPTYLSWMRDVATGERLSAALAIVCDEHDDEITAAIEERRKARRKW